jgi:hypothetical protein
MAAAPIKFRCFRCSQLLGVSRSKAGAVVACPKCGVELIVPEPADSEPRADVGAASPEPAAALKTSATPPQVLSEERSGTGATGPSLDFPDIRPEDIRVEPGIPLPAISPSPPPPTIGTEAYVVPGDPGPSEVFARPEPRELEAFPIARSAPAPLRSLAPVAAEFAAAPVAEQAIVPPIRIDSPSSGVATRRTLPPARSRDLVLPRSAVTAWSLFVLLALTLAFFAGLLAGHYVWRVH